jgi:asparagine synthase (glutamine-hydrolysing)
MPERLESWNHIYRAGQEVLLDPDFANSIDVRAPIRTMFEVYDAAPSGNLLDKMLYYDWHFTLSDNDLRKVGLMCELAGVGVSYPMLDQRMVDFSLRIPATQKIRGTQLRHFYKQAVVGFLPRAILEKSKHGFGLPFGQWLNSHAPLRDLIMGHLDNIKARRIVKATFVDSLIDGHSRGDASYYGYAIWDIAMLSAWLDQHAR